MSVVLRMKSINDLEEIRRIIGQHKRWALIFMVAGICALMIAVLTFMALFAQLINNEVFKISELETDEDIYLAILESDLIIDVTDLVITPAIGWVLNGNKIVPAPGEELNVQEMIKSKLRHLQKEALEILIEMYVQNTLLGITTQQADQMFDDYNDILIRIKEGAWPTALYRLSQKTPSGFVTQEMLDNWIALLEEKISIHMGEQ